MTRQLLKSEAKTSQKSYLITMLDAEKHPTCMQTFLLHAAASIWCQRNIKTEGKYNMLLDVFPPILSFLLPLFCKHTICTNKPPVAPLCYLCTKEEEEMVFDLWNRTLQPRRQRCGLTDNKSSIFWSYSCESWRRKRGTVAMKTHLLFALPILKLRIHLFICQFNMHCVHLYSFVGVSLFVLCCAGCWLWLSATQGWPTQGWRAHHHQGWVP